MDQRRPWWRSDPARTGALLLGTLALATAFIAAYVGTLHRPEPRDLPVGVASTDTAARQLLDAVRGQTDDIKPVGYDTRGAAGRALDRREVYAVLAPAGAGLALTTASAASPTAEQVIVAELTRAADQTRTPLTVTDRTPVSPRDPRGLTPFYLAVGLVLGGYLGATVLSLSLGTAPTGPRRALFRIGALALFAALLGFAGALLTGPVFDIWPGHLLAVTLVGTATVFAAALFTAAVQAWLGLLGTGLVILLLVVLGNPGSGGIYAPEFLPGPFRTMPWWNLPGLTNELLKGVVYFDRVGILRQLVPLAVWAVVGVAGLLAATFPAGRRRAPRHAHG
ncbi:MAG TPA: hypothetical protein VGD43_11495 [Micromonospora sp.]